MTDIIEDFVKSIAQIVLYEILARVLLWTGESVPFALSFGYRRPHWEGYRGNGVLRWVLFEISVGFLGASFWVCTIKLGVEIFTE